VSPTNCAWVHVGFQASAVVQMISSLFWDFTWHRLYLAARVLGQHIGTVFKGQGVQENGTDKFFRKLAN
jgi:hypothetical protein